MQKIKRHIPIEEVRSHPAYCDIADLAEIFNHEIIETDRGVWRFKENRLVELIRHNAPVFTPPLAGSDYGSHCDHFRASIDLNTLWMCLGNDFSHEELIKWYMQMGYSLCGFAEMFGQTEASVFFEDAPKPESDEYYACTVIDYMRQKHKGTVLKL